MQSVERRRPGASMRAYVTRTLPHSSVIVVSNRGPHEPRPEGGFARGAGGVVTALLTLAVVMGAEWVARGLTPNGHWQLPGAIIQHFIHIPWPTPQYWKVLPRKMRDAIRSHGASSFLTGAAHGTSGRTPTDGLLRSAATAVAGTREVGWTVPRRCPRRESLQSSARTARLRSSPSSRADWERMPAPRPW
jgi:hypothetical protein